MLLVLHPTVAYRDCGHCQKYVYLEDSGAVMRQKHGEPGPDGLMLPVLRAPNNLPPCRIKSIGCAKGTPENQRSLSEKNWRAYRHWQVCKATGKWPEDGIVMRNAGIIEAAFQRAEIDLRWLHQTKLETLLEAAVKTRAI